MLCTSSPGFLGQYYNFSDEVDYSNFEAFDSHFLNETTPDEAVFQMWGTHSCAQMQDQYGSCTDAAEANHKIVMHNCPITCANARNDVPMFESPALVLAYASSSHFPVSANAAFSARWTGYLHIDNAGVYVFKVQANKAAWLWIDKVLVVGSDSGEHGFGEIEQLTRGYHTFRLHFIGVQGSGSSLDIVYSGPDTANTVAPEYNPNGEEACEGHEYDETTCNAIGCCHWNTICMSSVGQGPCYDNPFTYLPGYRTNTGIPSQAPTCHLRFKSLRSNDFESSSVFLSIEVAGSDFAGADEQLAVKLWIPGTETSHTVGTFFQQGGQDARCDRMYKVLICVSGLLSCLYTILTCALVHFS